MKINTEKSITNKGCPKAFGNLKGIIDFSPLGNGPNYSGRKRLIIDVQGFHGFKLGFS